MRMRLCASSFFCFGAVLLYSLSPGGRRVAIKFTSLLRRFELSHASDHATTNDAAALKTWRSKECTQLLTEFQNKPVTERELRRKHVFVFSHRRSGTHLTINLIRFGFKNVVVWKTNHVSCSNCSLITSIQTCGGYVVHAYRNPLDVAISLHNYKKSFSPAGSIPRLEDFIRKEHVSKNWSLFTQNCFAVPNVFHIPFEMTRSNPTGAFHVLKEFLGESGQWSAPSVAHSGAVEFNGGEIGQWNKIISDGLLREVVSHWTGTWHGGKCECDRGGVPRDGHSCTPPKHGFTTYSSP